MLLLLYVKMGSSEEMIRLLGGDCLTEIRKIEQELLQKLNATICDDGIIDKLKHIFSRDRYAEGVIPSSTKAILCEDDANFMVATARYVDHVLNLFLFI